jgi:predicted TIM-barrel fold metal-dependent hydrolase
MKIQDAHTHFFSRPFFDALASASPRDSDRAALVEEVAAAAGLQLPDADVGAHRDRWLAEMDGADVERMVTFASLPQEAPTVSEAAAGSGGRLIPYTLVNPMAENAAAFTEKALGQMGFRGLLTFPAMHHFSSSDEALNPIYELAVAHDAPVIVHCGVLRVKLRDLFGLPRPYDLSYAHPLDIVPAANRFPKLTFVLPHFGGGFLSEALMVGMQCENVCVDTSSSNDWTMTAPGRPALSEVFRAALDVFGADRILFGTDSSTFPRGWRKDVADTQLAALEEAGSTAEQVEQIMGGNLARLLPA